MIIRNANSYTRTQEPLEQSSFTALRGIDSSKAPTQEDTVLDAINLDIDYDGGLILRKPLTIVEKFENVLNVSYLFDKYTYLKVYKHLLELESPILGNHPLLSCKFTDIYGETHEHTLNGTETFIDFTNCKIVDTATSTILSNVKVNLENLTDETGIQVYNPNVESKEQYRLFNISKSDEGVWVLNMYTPEINWFTTSDIAVDFNTALHNPFALRDNAEASNITVPGIVAYHSKVFEVTTGYFYNDMSADDTLLDTDDSKRIMFSYIPVESDVNHTGTFLINSKKYNTQIFAFFSVDAEEGTVSIHLTFSGININAMRSLKLESFVPINTGLGVIEYHLNVEFTQKEFKDLERDPSSGHYIFVYPFFQTTDTPISIDNSEILVQVEASRIYNPVDYYIDTLTESDVFFKISDSYPKLQHDDECVVLKAFITKFDILKTGLNLRCFWEYSSNGVDWKPISTSTNSMPYTRVFKPNVVIDDVTESKTVKWEILQGYSLIIPSYRDIVERTPYYKENIAIQNSASCLILDKETFDSLPNATYRFTIVNVKKDTLYDPPEDFSEYAGDRYFDMEFDSKSYYFTRKKSTLIEEDFDNPNTGSMLYWNNSLYSTSPKFKNTIYVSDVDGVSFPMSRIIDISSVYCSVIQTLLPWRNYLLAFTDTSIHLIQPADYGFVAKTINTFIGLDNENVNTCVSTLNGIMFKSGSKIYSIAPNYSSGDDTILNISDVSKPIQHILDSVEYNGIYKPFAFTSSEAYYIFIPADDYTVCLKYNYSLRVWTHYTYPVVLYKYEILDASNIILFSIDGSKTIKLYTFDKEPNIGDEFTPYGDLLETDENGKYITTPIYFKVDSGQKTDNISLTKQFVESKFIVSTLSKAKDSFLMDVRVLIDGDEFIKHLDVSTDGAFYRSSQEQILTLSTNIRLNDTSEILNTMRQMVLRYSGKGKTIRHVITGQSLYKFKIYEVFYRFRILNVKQ